MSKAKELMRKDASSGPSGMSLAKLQVEARKLWAAQEKVAYFEEELKKAKAEVNRLSTTEVLAVFDGMHIDALKVSPDGNMPGFEVEVKTYYEGGISAEWDEERREKAFGLLEQYGHGGLIKNIVTVQVPRSKTSAAIIKKLDKALTALDLMGEIKKGVHPGTFKKWLKEEMTSGRPMPPLDEIGAFVQRRVSIKRKRKGDEE